MPRLQTGEQDCRAAGKWEVRGAEDLSPFRAGPRVLGIFTAKWWWQPECHLTRGSPKHFPFCPELGACFLDGLTLVASSDQGLRQQNDRMMGTVPEMGLEWMERPRVHRDEPWSLSTPKPKGVPCARV